MQISGSDIHLLMVFDSVVRNSGFSAAQAELGLSQPTISNHITALEERLGVKLCQRGRRGFLLTHKGEVVHEIARELLNTLEKQSDKLTALKGSLIGKLAVAVVDCSASDKNLKLSDAIHAMAKLAPAVRINMEIRQPQDILSGISDGTYHIGVGSFDNKINGLKYEDLYVEVHSVYCGTDHAVLSQSADTLTADRLYTYPWVHRGYWSRQRQKQFQTSDHDRVVHDIEAQLFLVLSGQYLGLLPDHTAQSYVDNGRLRKIPNVVEQYSCTMQMVSRSGKQPKIVETFRSLLNANYGSL